MQNCSSGTIFNLHFLWDWVFFMNKIFFILVFTLFSSAFSAADLTLENGSVYAQTEVKKCAAGFVYIAYEKGEAKIALNDLPENFIAALNSRQRGALRKGGDLTLADGRTFKNTSVKVMGNKSLTIKHDSGTAVVAFKDLPKKYQATFNRQQLLKIFNDKTATVNSGNIVGKTADGKIVYSGPRGGRYFINDSGKRVYLRKNIEVKVPEGIKSNAGRP